MGKCPVEGGGEVVDLGSTGEGKGTYYFHADHLGSSSYLTDARGEVFQHLEYFPYGEVWREAGPNKPVAGSDYRFTGKPQDPETGLVYFGARYYDPARARWASVDRAFLEQGTFGLNVYQYGAWNPLSFRDPDGNRLEGFTDYARVLFLGEYDQSDLDDYAANPTAHNLGFLSAGVGAAAAAGAAGAALVGAATSTTVTITVGKLGGAAVVAESGLDVVGIGVGAIGCAGGDQSSCGGAIASALDLATGFNPVGDAVLGRNLGSGNVKVGGNTFFNSGKKGPYSNIPDSPSVGPGKKFTGSQKAKILDQNAKNNGGQLRSDLSGKALVKAKKSMKGVTPPGNVGSQKVWTPS